MAPNFPRFAQCIERLHSHDALTMEDGFHWLLPRVSELLAELFAAFEDEGNVAIRHWLLELIGEAKSSTALSLLAASLRSPDESLRAWAIHGLHALDRAEARQLLSAARAYTFATLDETARFQGMLATIVDGD